MRAHLESICMHNVQTQFMQFEPGRRLVEEGTTCKVVLL